MVLERKPKIFRHSAQACAMHTGAGHHTALCCSSISVYHYFFKLQRRGGSLCWSPVYRVLVLMGGGCHGNGWLGPISGRILDTIILMIQEICMKDLITKAPSGQCRS